MGKNFDIARKERQDKARLSDLSFTFAGEMFNRRAQVIPEVLLPLDEIKAPVRGPKNAENPEGEILEAGSTVGEDFAAIDKVIIACIDTEDDETAEGRYLALRQNTKDVVTVSDLRELMEWLIQECSGRPTGRPADSQPTAGPTGTTSTGGSSSPEPQAD